MHDIAFESHGVRIGVATDRPEVAARLADVLPPGAQPCPVESVQESFGLMGEEDGAYVFTRSGSPVARNLELDFGLTLMEIQIRLYLGQEAPNRIFVHAGVVAVEDRAIVLPGRSFAGKTTLVRAFVQAGAIYFSDEFAIFDGEGRVHPFLTRLAFREGENGRSHVHVGDLGGASGEQAMPVGAVVVTSYRPDATWEPHELTPGRAALALLNNTLAVLFRHQEALSVFARSTVGALLLEGERGEPDVVVADVLSRLGR